MSQSSRRTPAIRCPPDPGSQASQQETGECEERDDEPARGRADRKQLAHGLRLEAVAGIEIACEEIGSDVDQPGRNPENQQRLSRPTVHLTKLARSTGSVGAAPHDEV